MITMEELYYVKNNIFNSKKHALGKRVSWKETNPDVLQYLYTINNVVVHEEVVHNTLTQQLNEAVGEITPCLVTEFFDKEFPNREKEKTYYLYFYSLSNREGINESAFILRAKGTSFSRFNHYALLPNGECESEWESVDLYFFQNRLVPLVEDMLLHLPEYRLRYLTGELHKR